MKSTLYKCLLVIAFFYVPSSYAQQQFKSDGLQISIGDKGRVLSFYGDREYLPEHAESYLVRIKIEGEEILPEEVNWSGEVGEFRFPKGIIISVLGIPQKEYIRFEVVEVKNPDPIDVLLWGPYATTIDKTIGEYVGVVKNDNYALGYQSLNVQTTGGKMLNSDGSDEARGTTATKEVHGSSLQGYCINRDKLRVYDIWNDQIPQAVIPANPEGKLVGSAIALFGVAPQKVLDILEKIELQEGLPHSTINGVWVKRSPEANKPYLITTFTEESIDQCLDYCERLGYNTLYHEHPFKNWGHFELIEAQFPNGWDGMKACVEKAKARGIRLGVHTLTNFITTNDPYVTPVPHEDLMIFSQTTLSKDIDEHAQDIYIDDSAGYTIKNACQAIRIGDEIIQFGLVSKDPPYALLKCKRGAYGTSISVHKAGDKVARLADHGYKTFFPNFELQKEMIDRLAEFFNYTGVGQLDFDGHEGGWGTGEGDYGMDYFSDRLAGSVNHELRNGSSRSNHYYWHVNSYLNWGEPWYGGFTKSQGHYRYQNQALLKRNYTPNMLGWFLLNSTTTLQEFEYMLARSAGYDAGYALYTKLIHLAQNKELEDILQAINTWEEARLQNIFNEEQLKALRNVNNDFSLNKLDEATYALQYYEKQKFELLNEMVQPGQPNDVLVEFDCKDPQDLYLVIGAVGEQGSIDQVTILYDGFETISVEVALQPNYAITYRGDNKMLIYDEKGRLKSIEELDISTIALSEGAHNLRISADFSEEADLKLEGYVRIKDKVESIVLK